MKVLLKFLAVCLIALVMLSPALVIWRIWHYHNAFIAAQHTVLLGSSMSDLAIALVQDTTATPTVQAQLRSAPSTTNAPVFISFIASVLVGFYSGQVLNRYQTRRSRLRQQVATLEKIWQQNLY